MTDAAYLASAGLCIGSIACLSQQGTARLGNALGLVGVGTGIAATMGVVPHDPALLTQIAGAWLSTELGRTLAVVLLCCNLGILCRPRDAPQ